MADWRSMICYVPQSSRLFSGTIAANIAPGEAAPDRARLETAVREADLADVISRLPDGLDARIGESGAGLSGGEAHRLALARAFYRDAPVIVLDEPTAHLDGESEVCVQAAIKRFLPGRAALMVTHRKATLDQADRVVGVKDGRLADPADVEAEVVS